MTEREIRIDMQPRWRVAQARFIDLCGGDMEAMAARRAERDALEAPLVAEYHARAKVTA